MGPLTRRGAEVLAAAFAVEAAARVVAAAGRIDPRILQGVLARGRAPFDWNVPDRPDGKVRGRPREGLRECDASRALRDAGRALAAAPRAPTGRLDCAAVAAALNARFGEGCR